MYAGVIEPVLLNEKNEKFFLALESLEFDIKKFLVHPRGDRKLVGRGILDAESDGEVGFLLQLAA